MSPEEMSPEEMPPEELSYDDLPDGPDRPLLPIPEIFAGVYRHIWRHRWPYLGQLAIWTLLIWLSQFPAKIATYGASWAGIFVPVGDKDILPWLVTDVVNLFFLTFGGGVTFLSCGCAFLFGRRPRAGDSLQIPKIGTNFWLAIFLFWLAAHLAAAVALRVLTMTQPAFYAAVSFLGVLGLLTVQDAYPILVWAVVGLALPIAAFEKAAAPFQEAWRRQTNLRLGVLLLSAVAAMPVLILQFAFLHARNATGLMLFDFVPSMGLFYAFAALLACADIFLSLLLFLVLSATTLAVYQRLAPNAAELAKTFD